MQQREKNRSVSLPKMRVSLPVIIEVRSRIRAASSPTGHQDYFTLSNSATNHASFIFSSVLKSTKQEMRPKTSKQQDPADQPEEHAHSGAAHSCVGRACSHILPIQLTEAAGALRTQHGPTNQTQSWMLPLINCRFWTPERRQVRRVTHLQHGNKMNKEDSAALTENGWLYSGGSCNPLEAQSTGSLSSDICEGRNVNKLIADDFK